jgi:FMN phosphatase YigB (HAD superfamily)
MIEAEWDKVHLFVDMDGVIAKFETDGKCTLEDWYKEGVFRNKKPVYSVINKLKDAQHLGIKLYILSASPHSLATDEKKKWLEQYCGFIPSTDWYFVSLGDYKINMLEALCERLGLNKKYVHILDDTHSILYEAERKGFNAVHISTFID